MPTPSALKNRAGMGGDWAAVRREHFPGADTHAAYLNSAVAGLLSAPA